MKDVSKNKQQSFIIRLLIILPFLSLSATALSQTLSVESFRLLDNDLTAITTGTLKYDQNGDVAAIIKIVTTENDFNFDVGSMGVVATSQQKGEIWVYVPGGVQRITISHAQLGVLRNYYFPVPIEKARTYELVLSSGRVRTIVQDQVSAQFVTFIVTPKNAIVTIDNDKQYSLQSDGTLSQLLSYGTHTYRVDAPGYYSENGVVEIGRERTTREVNLTSSLATVTLECAMEEAEIYVNGSLVGKGKWTGNLDAAMYMVDVKREGYTTRTTSFTLEPKDDKTVSLPVPQPIYGTISVTSVPIGATVYVDGEPMGTTPLLKSEILTGHRNIEFRKKDYRPVTMVVDVKEGEITSFSAELTDEFTLSVTTNPTGASLSINGENKGHTPYSTEMSSGDYLIKLTKSGYLPYKETLHLGGDNSDISIKLIRKVLSSNNFYLGAGYTIGRSSGIGGNIGSYMDNFNFELSYLKPMNSTSTVWWMADPSSWTGELGLVYDYSLSHVFAFRTGYGILLGNRARITPQLGVQYNYIEGKYAEKSTMPMDQTTFVLSGLAGIRAEYSLWPHVGVVCVPTYSMPIKKGDLAAHLDENSRLIKDWCGGITLNVGVELFF